MITPTSSSIAHSNVLQDCYNVAAVPRDLCVREDCRIAFGESEVVKTIFGLLYSESSLRTQAAQALAKLATETGPRKQIVEAGGNLKFVKLLQEEEDIQPEFRTAILQIVLGLAIDDVFQLAFRGANGLPCVIKILGESKDQGELEAACQVVGRLGSHDGSRIAVREHQGIRRMVHLLKRRDTQPGLAKAVVEALAVLVADNEVNQDHVREEGGVVDIIRLLDARGSKPLAGSAISCITALAINNQDVKDEVRDLWAIPLLVNLLSDEDINLVEKAVDCLRILTTGNEYNQSALYGIPAGIRTLVSIMSTHPPSASITERAAAVIGNLSTSEQFTGAIRECGGIQRLVVLLDSGPSAKVTEIAAKSLANMASSENNRKGIQLAGGRPALVHLLMQMPSSEVIQATEEALRRLQVTDAERNVALETLRYCEQKHEKQEAQQSQAPEQPQSNREAAQPQFTEPLTQFSVDQTCALLESLGITDTGPFRENGVTGGDLLELSHQEMSDNLKLSPLQVKKLNLLIQSFETFERISLNPGNGDITLVELQDWLQKQGRDKEEMKSIVYGFRKATRKDDLSQICFPDFARQYQWLMKTLKAMALSEQGAGLLGMQ